MFENVKAKVINAFVERAARVSQFDIGSEDISIYENPTEEMLHDLKSGRPVKLHARGIAGRMVQRSNQAGARGFSRLEENYLYASRRFPVVANNTIGSGALIAGRYPFFGKAVGDPGDGMGFPSGFTVTTQETNMEVPGQVPLGSNFVFNQLGVSFNANASVADVNQLLEAATLEFSKGNQFIINHGPVKFWPGGFGNGGFAATTATTTTIQHGSNGAVDLRAVRNLRIARTLREKETFTYSLNIARATDSRDGTAFALSNFVVCTIWLWGAVKAAVPS